MEQNLGRTIKITPSSLARLKSARNPIASWGPSCQRGLFDIHLSFAITTCCLIAKDDLARGPMQICRETHDKEAIVPNEAICHAEFVSLCDLSAMETSPSAVADRERERERELELSQLTSAVASLSAAGQLPEGSELRLLSATQTAADCCVYVQKVVD